MDNQDLIREISVATPGKIIMLVIDGLGGLPDPKTGKTELETARIPHLDSLTTEGICGMADPIAPGITPGSGPGHLALFGYDPIRCNIGRGVLEAVGIDIELEPGDIAARGNFCTIDEKGVVTDRRAGRINNDKCAELCKLLDDMALGDVRIIVRPVREHRFVVIFRGKNLAPGVTDSDPTRAGFAPLAVKALNPESQNLADAANRFIEEAKATLAEHSPANMILLRGFSVKPQFATMQEIYKLNPLAIAVYPMYRGLARLVGMETASCGTSLDDEVKTLKQHYDEYDFFFLHIKGTDSAGEDGDFARKVKMLEQVDSIIPAMEGLKPDVLVVSGDHSTPAAYRGHSWHTVPVLIRSEHCRADAVWRFSEPTFLAGGLGRIKSTEIMQLAMANAGKLRKFGA